MLTHSVVKGSSVIARLLGVDGRVASKTRMATGAPARRKTSNVDSRGRRSQW